MSTVIILDEKTLAENSDALCVAARNGDVDEALRLIPISDPSVYEYTPIKWASQYGCARILEALIPVSQIERNGVLQGMMGDASLNGYLDCFNLLLPYTSEIKVDLYQVMRGAVNHGRTEILKILLPLVDPKTNDSAFFKDAVFYCQAGSIELLMPLSDTTGFDGTQSLIKAAEKKDHACVKLLLPFSDAKHNDSEALLKAVESNSIECVKLLAPFSDVGAQSSRALFSALVTNPQNIELHQLLYEGSDLQDVRAQLNDTPTFNNKWTQYLSDEDTEKKKQQMYPDLYDEIQRREQQKLLEKIALEAHQQKTLAVEDWRQHGDGKLVEEVVSDEPQKRKM